MSLRSTLPRAFGLGPERNVLVRDFLFQIKRKGSLARAEITSLSMDIRFFFWNGSIDEPGFAPSFFSLSSFGVRASVSHLCGVIHFCASCKGDLDDFFSLFRLVKKVLYVFLSAESGESEGWSPRNYEGEEMGGKYNKIIHYICPPAFGCHQNKVEEFNGRM